MHQPPFYLGEWQITPASNTIQRAEEQKQLEPKAMDVLLYLCQNQAEIVSSDALLTHCWANTETGDNPLHKTITQLRKALGDKASAPQYIETIRKRGYRVIATVEFPLADDLPSQVNTWQGGSPFLGLSAYNPTDTHLFFGRNHAISTLLESVSNQVTLQRAFCLILGPSGTGKSSLVNAGILPKLLDERGYNGIRVMSYTQLDFADVAQNRLYLDLASAMLDWDINDIPVFTGLSAQTLAQQLEHDIDNVISCLKNTIANIQTAAKTPQLFLFIDRLEVLLSSPLFSNDTRSHFLSVIERLATSKAVIVFSACRNDFYPLVVEQPSLMVGKANGAHYDLTPPNRHELQQIIRLPALTANLTFSQDPHTKTPLDEILCADTANNPDALPMLQYTLQELYLQRSDNNELLHSVYEKIGGIEGAIGKKAEEVFIGLSKAQQQQLKSVLSQLVTLNPDGKTITSRAARLQALTNTSQKELVQAMIDSRLFVSHLQNQEAYFSLAHEALLRQWPRAKQWINDHKDALAIKSRLHHHTQQWLNEHKSNAYLLAPGKPLQEAVTLLNDNIFELDDDERALITSSLKHSKTKTTIKRGTVALLCLLTCVALFMSVTSFQAQQLAQKKRQEAESLLGFMVGDFADKLRSVKRMDLLDGISNKALEYFTNQVDEPSSLFNFSSQQGEFKSRFQYAQTLEAMGEVAYSRGKTIEAFTAFENARIRLEALLKIQPNNLELLTLAGANAFWLGQLHYDENEYLIAKPFFEKYRSYSQQMYIIDPESNDAIIEMSDSSSTLGTLYLKLNDYSKAKSAFLSSFKFINLALLQKPNNHYLLTTKADTFTWLANIEVSLGAPSKAIDLHKSAQEQYKLLLSNSPSNALIIEYLSHSYAHESTIYSHLQQYKKAYDKILLANELLKKLLKQDKNNKKWEIQLNLQQSIVFKLSAILKIEQKNTLEKIDRLLNYNYKNNPTIQLAVNNNLIDYYQKTNKWKQSGQLISSTNKFVEQMISNGLIKNYYLLLSNLKLLTANQFIEKEEYKELNCKEALKLLKPFADESESLVYLLPFVKAHKCLSTLNAAAKQADFLTNLNITNFNL